MARGRTNAEIADELHISLSTVKTHSASLMAKLGARNRVELVMWAYDTNRIRGGWPWRGPAWRQPPVPAGRGNDQVHPDEGAATVAGFTQRALAFYAGLGVTVQRVLTDNGNG